MLLHKSLDTPRTPPGKYHAFLSTNGKLTDIGDLGGGSAVAYGHQRPRPGRQLYRDC
jgi:hypothetical protein